MKQTIRKLERLYKQGEYSHKRIGQVAMILRVRLRVLQDKKPQEYKLSKKYTDFLEDVSINLSLIEIMSAMTPCMRLYSWLGKKLLNMISDNPYKEWILTYSDESFDILAKSLENLIDEYDEDYDIDQVNFLYKRAMELELDFFNAYSSFS